MMPVEIMPFNGQLQDGIGRFINDIQRNEFDIPVTLDDQPDLSRIRDVYQHGNGNFWTAYDGDKLIGTIALLDAGQHIGVLRKMFVHRDYRGKANGVAQKLLQQLLQWAKEHRFTDIYLGTVEVLEAAAKFYEKNGFSRIDEQTLPPPAQHVKMKVDTTYYHKALNV